jgi:cytochrome c oxidase cbb3-type subunit 3
MRQVITVCVLALAAAAVMPAQVAKPKNPLGNSLEVVAEGRAIYNKSCTGCHGPDGGEGDRAPSLDANRRYFRLSEAAIFDTVKNGIPGTVMPASGLPEKDVWKIVAFIRNIRSTASDNIVSGDVQQGMAVFTGAGGCVRCHMIRGQGGVLGPDLSSIGAQLSLKKLEESLTKEGPIPNGYRPVSVRTRTGETVSGVARNGDAFSIQVLDERGKLHLFETSELSMVTYSDHSLMPHNIDKILTSDQYRDLLAMLAKQARTKMKLLQQGENEIGR